jgi:hypothetical protein
MTVSATQRIVIAASLFGVGVATSAGERLPAWMKISSIRPAQEAREHFAHFRLGVLAGRSETARSHEFDGGSLTIFSGRESWSFFANPGAVAPDSAYRLIEPSSLHYRVTVELFCDESECDELRERLRSLRAPKVDLGEDERLKAEWRAIVANEACNPLLPVGARRPVRPAIGMRPGAEATVQIKVFHNRCGEVREVIVERSSGNVEADSMARIYVSGLRVAPKPANTSGWSLETVRVPAAAPSAAKDTTR